jgi:hypothetical protein
MECMDIVDQQKIDVGPFLAEDVPDYVRAVTVVKNQIPVVLYQTRFKMIDGVEQKQERYAVMLPPNKDVGVVCAGCYSPNISLWNNSKCVSPRTFAKHLDTRQNADGDPVRKHTCITCDPLENCVKRVNGCLPIDDDLLQESGQHHHVDVLIGQVGVEAILNHIRNYHSDVFKKYIGPVVGASFEQLEAEMRRLVSGVTRKEFYNPKRFGKDPNFLDDPVIKWEDISFRMYERMYGTHK